MQSFFALLDLVYALLGAAALAVLACTPHVAEARQAMLAVGALVVLRWGLTIVTAKLVWSERLLATLILTMFLVSAQPRFEHWAGEREAALQQAGAALVVAER